MRNGTKVFPNPHSTLNLDGEFPSSEGFAFHKRLPGYIPSPLINALTIAQTLGVGRVWVSVGERRVQPL